MGVGAAFRMTIEDRISASRRRTGGSAGSEPSISRLTLTLVLGVALPVIGLLMTNSVLDFRHRLDESREVTHLIASTTAATVDQYIEARKWIVESVASHAGTNFGESECTQLRTIQRLEPDILRLEVFDADGSMVCRTFAQIVNEGQEAVEISRAKVAMGQGQLQSDGLVLESDLGWVLVVAYPVGRDSIEADRAVVAFISLEPIHEIISNHSRSVSEALVTLTTMDGTVVSRSDQNSEWIGRRLPEAEDPGFGESLHRDGTGDRIAPAADGTRRHFSYQALATSPWTIFVGVPSAVLYAPLRAYLLNRAGFGLLVLLVTLRYAGKSTAKIRNALQKEEREALEDEVAKAELRHAIELKDQLLASMNHELRTQLNTVLGMSEAMQEGVYGSLNTEQQESVELIRGSGEHLLGIIDQIMDFTLVDSNQMKLERSVVGIEELSESSLGLVRLQAERKGVAVEFENQASRSFICVDVRRMETVLTSLLDNALKFTPAGQALGLRVTESPEAEEIQFEVWDTGIGIPDEDLRRLFVPFSQLDARLSREYEGTGLSLCVAKELVELHGGNLVLTSTLGEGTTASVRMPWEEANPNLPTIAA